MSDTSTLRVYNTLTKTKAPFAPIHPPQVGMYLCGPTVYAESHIGHMVGPVIFDTIKRYLTFCGYEVNWVVNITDVDDKLIAKSRERGIPMSQIATEMTADYLSNLRALGVDQINHLPRATDHIGPIIELIECLIAKDVAYPSGGDVFFDVTADPNYGQLSNRSVDAQQGEGGEAAAKKRNAGDFALWKAARPGEPSWPSPWGDGRPGWHIECSAMSKAILGETFDIHGGGLDLMFPHHENELAQSSCCHGKPMAGVWMHNGLMRAGGDAGKVGGRADREAADDGGGKISRSKGAGGLAKLIAEHTGERLRFFLLRTHYRSTNVFGDGPLREAGVALESFYRFFDRFQGITGTSFYELPRDEVAADITVSKELLENFEHLHEQFIEAMNDDFNTGAAIGVLFDALRSFNRYLDAQSLAPGGSITASQRESLEEAGGLLAIWSNVLGLFQKAPIGGGDDSSELLDATVRLLIDLRKEARERKDYATGDAIRGRLTEIGIALLDSKDGTSWEKA